MRKFDEFVILDDTNTIQKFVGFSELINRIKIDYDKLIEKGNKAAGTRARKRIQLLRTLCRDMRFEIQELKKNVKDAE